jgi:hypothetical protein
MLFRLQVNGSTPMGEVNFAFVQRIDKDPRTHGIEWRMALLIDSNLIDDNNWAVE